MPGKALRVAVLKLLRTTRLNWLMLVAAVVPAWQDLLLHCSSGYLSCPQASNHFLISFMR